METQPNLTTLHETDLNDMEYFLEQTKLIIHLMGFNFLSPSTLTPKDIQLPDYKAEIKEPYFIKTKTFKASIIKTDRGYIVSKGREAKKLISNSFTKTYSSIKRKRLDTELMIEASKKLIFNEDAIFNSTNTVSNIILEQNSNGFS